MVKISDFQILQRDENGKATAIFRGSLPPDAEKDARVCMRAVYEDSGMTVIPWTECDIHSDEWSKTVTLPEGGLYRLEAALGGLDSAIDWSPRIKNVCHVGVGDIYIMTGQSNMSGYGRDCSYDPPELGVHIYANDGSWKLATQPLNDSIDTVYPENAEHCSGASPALSFARNLKNRLGVPIGLVAASLGGSPLSYWEPAQNGKLYLAMLRRLEVVGNIKGILWYQGCTDATDENEALAETYYDRFCAMVGAWREKLGRLPILTVQLNRWPDKCASDSKDRAWGLVIDAQRRAALCLPEVYVVPSYDLAVVDGIHNSAGANVVLGERLANAALEYIYGRPGMTAPTIISAEHADNRRVRLRISPKQTVYSMGSLAEGMNIEDRYGIADCLSAEMTDGGLIVTCEREFTLPAQFHFHWRRKATPFYPIARHGLPLISCYGIPIL